MPLAELHAGAGQSPAEASRVTAKAHAAGGSLLPHMRPAADGRAHVSLTVFDGPGRALWLDRSKQLSSADQRIVLHGRDRGCTRPGCGISGYLWSSLVRWPSDCRVSRPVRGNRYLLGHCWPNPVLYGGRGRRMDPTTAERCQPRMNPFHFIKATTDYHTRKTPPAGPDDDRKPAA